MIATELAPGTEAISGHARSRSPRLQKVGTAELDINGASAIARPALMEKLRNLHPVEIKA
jgi:hypothetical protein